MVRLPALVLLARGGRRAAFLLRLRHEGAGNPAARPAYAAGAAEREALDRPFRSLAGRGAAGVPSGAAAARRPRTDLGADRGSGRDRPVGMRTLLSRLPVRRLGWQESEGSD